MDERTEDELSAEEELNRLLMLELLLEREVATLELLAPTTPQGVGWLAQVEREIQLLLLSQPHPLCAETHRG